MLPFLRPVICVLAALSFSASHAQTCPEWPPAKAEREIASL